MLLHSYLASKYYLPEPSGFRLFLNNNRLFLVYNKNSFFNLFLFIKNFFICKTQLVILYTALDFNLNTFLAKKRFLANFIAGSLRGFRMNCKLFGVGYKVVSLKAESITLKLGRSHKVRYFFHKSLKVKVFGKRRTKIKFWSSDLIKLTTSIFLFRRLKFPDSYKGKGIRFVKQKIKLKYREKFGSLHYKGR